MGISYSDNTDDLLLGNLTAALRAEPGATMVGVKSISVLGGDITGDLAVTGKVGNIITKCVGVVTNLDDPSGLTIQGGGLSSGIFHASSFGAIAINGGDLSANVLADNSIGAVSILYGTLSGTLTATTGAIGNISVKSAPLWLLDPAHTAFTGAASAGTTIGAVTVEGGNMTATLTARNAIGNISVKALTVNAEGGWDNWGDAGAPDWEPWNQDSVIFGDQCVFTINLGGGATINTLAKLGAISGTGVAVTVRGTVPWNTSFVKLSTKKVSYISSVDTSDNVGHTAIKITSRLPGDGDLATYLHNNLTDATTI
jgi:hypothetical protein